MATRPSSEDIAHSGPTDDGGGIVERLRQAMARLGDYQVPHETG